MTPYFSIGIIKSLPSFSSANGRASSTPNILGIDGPKISVSRSPTLYPNLANAIDIFTATVDLPTPPFPELMAIIFWTSGSNLSTVGLGWERYSCFMETFTSFDI